MEAMELMDPKRRRRHNVMLFVGYGLIGVAILLLTIILIFVAYGFGYQNGHVIQNGLVFLSSTPNPAKIYINNEHYKNDTNTKLVLPAGTYNFTLQRAGYRDWERSVTVAGGQVQTFVYPFLFPSNLTTNTRYDYAKQPLFITESPDRQWLVVAHPGTFGSFDLFDLTSIDKQPVGIALPAGVLTAGSSQSFQTVAWAGDNRHLLLAHHYNGKTEYIILDRSVPAQSINVSAALNLAASDIDVRLDSSQYDHYFVLNKKNHTLYRLSLSSPTLIPYRTRVSAFATYGASVLYTTPDQTTAGQTDTRLYDGNQDYLVRHDNTGGTYQLALTAYNGSEYAAISSTKAEAAYVYKDPILQIQNKQIGVAVPVRAIRLQSANYVSFSGSGQYVAFENGTHMAVYDAQNDQAFTYQLHDGIDSPQAHVAWMDGARLVYISHGQTVVVDYDGTNRQVLVPADPRYQVIFDQKYTYIYTLQLSASSKTHELLTSTSLRAPADQ